MLGTTIIQTAADRPVSPRRFIVNEAVVEAEVDGEMVLLNVDSGVYFGLDNVGTEIWRLLPRSGNEEELRRQLVDEFDVDADILFHDLDEFLGELEARGLLRIQEEG